MTTTVQQDHAALGAAVSGLGLELGGPVDAAVELSQPVLTAVGLAAGADRPSVLIAVIDGDTQSDAMIQAIAGAVARVRPDLEFRPGDPLPSVEVLTAAVDAPSTIRPVRNAGAVIGAIIDVDDRRAAVETGDPVTPAPVGSTTQHSRPAEGFDLLRNVEMTVTAELGRTELKVSEILGLQIGSVLELDRAAGAPIDLRVNGTLLARGEVVVVDEEYAVRLTEIIDPKRM